MLSRRWANGRLLEEDRWSVGGTAIYVITPIALEGGTTVSFPGAGGVELVWNAVTSKWEVLAGQNITVL